MRRHKIYVVLIIIVLISAFLRLYQLDKIPSGLYVDEAVIGYNAYSFLLTGLDEFGQRAPVFLRSFGAYSSPLYTYLTVIPTALFDLNPLSTRYLSALSGILSTLLVYLIAKKGKYFKSEKYNLVACFLFAITPWSLFYSRGAYEASLGLLLLLTVIYLMLEAKAYRECFYLSMVVLSLSTYAYQAERLIAYLLIPLIVYNAHDSKSIYKRFINKSNILAIGIFLIFQIPQLVLIREKAFTSRATGLFYTDVIQSQAGKMDLYLPQFISTTLAFSREFTSQFVSYFSPKNLFFSGDSDEQRSIPEMSVFYGFLIIPYLLGFYVYFKNLNNEKFKILGLLMIIFVLAPSLTRNPFSSLRSLPLIMPFIIIITIGLEKLYESINHRLLTILLIALFYIYGFLFWRSYFVFFPQEKAKVWGFGYKELAEITVQSPDITYVIDQSRAKPSYILLAYFLKYPPDGLQKIAKNKIIKGYYQDSLYDTDYNIGNLEIRNIIWEDDIYRELVLVGDNLAISPDQATEHYLTKVFEIKDPLGETVFEGYKTNPKAKCQSINFNNQKCYR